MYSVEINYELENDISMTMYDFQKNYLEIIKKEKEVKNKDKILKNYADKYNGIVNSHDFDTIVDKNENLDDFKNLKIAALGRNLNFLIEPHNILDFIKNLSNEFNIVFIKKYVDDEDYTVFNKGTNPDFISFDTTDKLVYKNCLITFIQKNKEDKKI